MGIRVLHTNVTFTAPIILLRSNWEVWNSYMNCSVSNFQKFVGVINSLRSPPDPKLPVGSTKLLKSLYELLFAEAGSLGSQLVAISLTELERKVKNTLGHTLGGVAKCKSMQENEEDPFSEYLTTKSRFKS